MWFHGNEVFKSYYFQNLFEQLFNGILIFLIAPVWLLEVIL